MRTLARMVFAAVLVFLSFIVALTGGYAQTTSSADAQAPALPSVPQLSGISSGPRIWLQQNQPLPVQHVAVSQETSGPVDLSGLGHAQPVSLTSGDLDADGYEDLVVGYSAGAGGYISLHRGNIDAFAPQSDASFQALGRGEFASPFQLEARTFSVPVHPDFVALGNFTGQGNKDLAVAAKGGNVLYIFPNDGKGNLGSAQTVNVGGGITALAAGRLGRTDTLIVGGSRSLTVYVYTPLGLTPLASYAAPGPVTNILFGDFGDAGMDVAFLSGGKIQILRSSTMQLAGVSLPVTVRAFALGTFIYDRNYGQQIAVVAPDGRIQIAVRNEFDPRVYTLAEFQAIRQASVKRQRAPAFVPPVSFPANGWKIVESFAGAAALGANQTPLIFRTRISINGADDVMVLNAFSGQLTLISHGDGKPGALTFQSGQVSLRPYNGAPIAALPMRLNVDGRMGVMAIHQNEVAPSAMVPIPDPNFFVNTDNDPTPTSPIANACNNTSFTDTSSSCSLREAILKANGDTVMLQAGHTYSLTIGRGATQDYTGNTGALYVNNTATIVGGNQNTTIVQWGTPSTGTVDMVMAVNEDISIISDATGSLSNLTIQGGVNHGSQNGFDGDGGCMEFDTGASGTATLTLTNVTLQNCSTLDGGGGGIVIFNATNPGAGGATISNSIFQGNSVTAVGSAGNGGGIAIAQDAHMTMTASQVMNNRAVEQCNPGCGLGDGGGIIAFTPQNVSAATGESFIHSSTISGNKAAGFGGGINTSASISIDASTVISSNIAGTDGSNNTAHANQEGGGLYLNPLSSCPLASTCTVTLSKVTITGNNATGNGGGISYGNGSAGTVGALSMNFSRLAGNTSSGGSGSNFSNNHGSATVTNNWWGTNAASSTINTISGTTTFDPFIVLTHTGSPDKIKINQSSTLTGNMANDNHGNAVGLANLTEIIGLPITFDGAVLGTIPQAQPETLNANAQATATFNAGGTSGFGTANATVDQAVVPVNSNLIASATESGTTATITTVGAIGFAAGDFVRISGVGVAGYNSSPATQVFKVLTTPTATSFTYTANTAGLGPSSGGTANAGIIILEPPSITKSFGGTKVVKTNTANTITFSITNGNVVPINASFTDNLPTNVGTVPGSLVVATPPNVVNNCGGSVTATAGTSTISFSNAALAVGSCTIKVDVESAVDNIYSNSVTIDSTDAGNGNTASDTLNVINPPSIAKNFGAATIPLNGTTSLSIQVSNPNQNQTLSAITFTDTLPNTMGTLVVATPNGLTNNCSGTATANAGSGSVSLSSSSLAAGASCTVAVNVQGTAAGVANNSVTASDATAGSGAAGTASITIIAPPSIAKAFSPNSIPLNGTSTLTFTITNPAANTVAESGVAFTDTLPTGLVVATPNGLTSSCGGTASAASGGTSISLTGGSIAVNSSCTVVVNVTGTAAGAFTNTSGAVSSTNGGTGNTATDTLTVVAPPSIAKAFNPNSIPVNGTSTLTFTITNPAANTVAESGVAFSDTLPTGLVVATPNGLTSSCGGTASAASGGTSISLTGGSIAVNSSCTLAVNVTGGTAGSFTNTSGAVSSTNGGTGNTATDTLTVVAPPSIAKAFSPSSIPLNGTSTLTFTITNPAANTVAESGVAFSDTLPTGLVVSTPNGLTSTCGGTASATSGGTSISLTGGSVAVNSSCTVVVNVTGAAAGAFTNTSGAVSSTNGGTGNTATDTLTVIGPPSIAKAFTPNSIPVNGTTTLTFTITNPAANTVAESGVAFSDTLPAGLVVATPNGLTSSCGGTASAASGGTNISLTGGSIAVNSSCTLVMNVTGGTAGSFTNTSGAVSSTNGGTGNTATANLTVVAPPSIAKAFNPTSIPINGTTTLTFTITNPAANTVAESGVAFSDTLPTGLVVSTPNGLTSTCGGTASATSGGTSISLTGGSIAVNSSCTVVVNVTGTASGQYTNTSGAVSSTNGGTGNTATANLTVASPPSISKAFGAATIPLNGTTSLTFNINNPNSGIALSGIAFTDSLPAGLVVATPSNLSSNCGGTATAVSGSGSVSLSGGTLAASASCIVTLNVTGTTAGQKNNSVTVSSTEGGTGNTASASITVLAPPTISKAFGAAGIPLNGSTSLSFTLSNPNASNTLTGIGFSDALPAGLIISTPNGLTGSCGGGTITATQNTGVISLSGATLTASASCTFSVNVNGTAAGTQNNTTGNVSSTEGGTGGTATASITVVAPPSIAKAFNPTSIPINGTTTLTFTITNPAANTVAESGVAFSDTLPTGLVVSTPNGLTSSCGGTASATSGGTSISLTGGSIAVNSSCTVVVNVTGTASGQYTNTSGAVSSTNGGTGNTATANLTVASPPSISKAFGAATIPLNGTTSLTFNISNPNSGIALSGIAFTDSLPAGLVVATPSNLSSNCGGTATAVSGSGSVSLSGGTLAASASCTVTLNVTGTTAGQKNNSVTVSSTEGGTGNTASASITVLTPPTISKAFGAASIPVGGSTSLSFTIQNPNTGNGLTGIGFSDTLPSGLVVSTPNGLTGSCGGGTITATQGTGVVSLSSGTLAANSSCTFTVNVTGTTAGAKVNTTSNVSSTEGGTGGSATATIHVEGPPSMAKAFYPSMIAPTGVSTLTFTITNPAANPDPQVGVAFSDTLPANVFVASPNGAVNNCGGTLTAVAGSGNISLSGGSVAVASSCTVSVNVTSAVSGTYNNTSGVVSSSNGGTGNTASATLTVAHASLTITKTHSGDFHRGSSGNNYTITVSNSAGAGPTIGTVTVTDTLPNVSNTMVPTAISGNGWSCNLGTLTCTRSDALAAGASYPAITLTVNVPIGIGGSTVTNSATVSGGGDPNSHTANDPTHIVAP